MFIVLLQQNALCWKYPTRLLIILVANLVKMTGKLPLYTNGYANVPEDAPGLGIELNDEEMKKHLTKKIHPILNQHHNG
jgi:hypothetical protein